MGEREIRGRGRQRCCEENEGIELMLADPVSCDPHAPSAGFSRQEAGLLSSHLEVHVDRPASLYRHAGACA